MSGMYLVLLCKSNSATNFLISSIATASSILPLVQAASHLLLQTLPQIAGKGLSFLIKAKASRNLPSLTILI